MLGNSKSKNIQRMGIGILALFAMLMAMSTCTLEPGIPAIRDEILQGASTTFTLSANGTINAVETTEIYISFSKEVAGLGINDLTIGSPDDTGEITYGTLTPDGANKRYTLEVSSVIMPGTVSIAVDFDKVPAAAQTVTVHKYMIFFSLSADGDAGISDTTEIIIEFSEPVPGLVKSNLQIGNSSSDNGDITAGNLVSLTDSVFALEVTAVNAPGIVTIVVNYPDVETTEKTVAVHKLGVLPRTLDHIAVTGPLAKTDYNEGETLVIDSGFVVTAYYSDGTDTVITTYTLTPGAATPLQTTHTEVIVSYTYGGHTETASFPITVTAVAGITLDHIAVTGPLAKTTYNEGDVLDIDAGFEVTAYYSDGTDEVITTYTLTPSVTTFLQTTHIEVIVSYTYGGLTETASFPITVNPAVTKTLDKIEVTNDLAKLSYDEEDYLDIDAGFEVTAFFDDLSVEDVTAYVTLWPDDTMKLYPVYTDVIVSYTYGGITKTTSFPITVDPDPAAKDMDYIDVTITPLDTYFEGDFLDITGLEVRAFYTDTTDDDITADVTLTPDDSTPLQTTDTTVLVEYFYRGVTWDCTFSITVDPITVVSIDASNLMTNTTYVEGECLVIDGTVEATYIDGSTEIITTYTLTPDETTPLQDSDIQVDVSFTDSYGTTVTDSIAITVDKKDLDYIDLSYLTKNFADGDTLDLDDLVITAYYTNTALTDTIDISDTGLTFTPALGTILDEMTDTAVDVEYTYDGNTAGPETISLTYN